MANRMLQYLEANALAERFPGCVLSGFDIPEWELKGPSSSLGKRKWPRIDMPTVDNAWLLSQIADGHVQNLRITSAVGDINLLPSRDHANRQFDAAGQPFFATGSDDLVIHVRLEDIMHPGRHVDYGPLPIAWYKALIETTGLRPVFVGQLSDDLYSTALRRAFPDGVFLTGGSVLHDFQTIRNAVNVAIGVSTFSWLAAWLGARERVFMPLIGMLNPNQVPLINLIPLGDLRYRYFEFPVRHWRAGEDDVRDVIDGPRLGKEIGSARVTRLVTAAARANEPALDAWRQRFSARMPTSG